MSQVLESLRRVQSCLPNFESRAPLWQHTFVREAKLSGPGLDKDGKNERLAGYRFLAAGPLLKRAGGGASRERVQVGRERKRNTEEESHVGSCRYAQVYCKPLLRGACKYGTAVTGAKYSAQIGMCEARCRLANVAHGEPAGAACKKPADIQTKARRRALKQTTQTTRISVTQTESSGS